MKKFINPNEKYCEECGQKCQETKHCFDKKTGKQIYKYKCLNPRCYWGSTNLEEIEYTKEREQRSKIAKGMFGNIWMALGGH